MIDSIESTTEIDTPKWRLDQLAQIEDYNGMEYVADTWWVIRRKLTDGVETESDKLEDEMLSISFDAVKASGGLIQLTRNGNRTGTFARTITGANKYNQESEVPEEIVDKLQEIGPW